MSTSNAYPNNIPAQLKRLFGRLAKHAERSRSALFVVGGFVRDTLLGRPTKDIDFVVEGDSLGLAKTCQRLYGGRLQVFDRFATVRLLETRNSFRLDFAHARTETYVRPAALPMVRKATLSQDLGRRDFSINAMALSLKPAGAYRLIDPYGGAADLRLRRIRILHPDSFKEDPTRIFRAARYAGRFNFHLERETQRRLHEAVWAGYAKLLSRERVRQELALILEEGNPGPAMRRLKAWGLFPIMHERFQWPGTQGARNAWTRLGLIAASMTDSGKDFIRSLHLDRDISQPLLLALDIVQSPGSPRQELPPLTHEILSYHFKDLPPAALKPLLINGRDLKRIGLTLGPEFSRCLDQASRAQWQGKFRDRARALHWLRKKLSP